jgi:hypothetical protein
MHGLETTTESFDWIACSTNSAIFGGISCAAIRLSSTTVALATGGHV